jgi:hypothetical protein
MMRIFFLSLTLGLAACGGSSPVYVAPPDDTDAETDTGADSDSDTDVDSDTDTDTDTGADTDADTDTDTGTGSDTDTGSETTTSTDTPPSGTWTLMFYFDGDNNLDDMIATDVDTLQAVIIPPWLNVVLLWDRSNNGDTRLYQVTGGGSKTRIADPTYLGLSASGSDELDMGDPATLEGLIDFSKASYPADNYGLFLSDHGDGWSKKIASGSGVVKGVCADDTSGNMLSVQTDVRNAVAGKGLDVIGFDACLEAMIEVGWVLKDDAAYMMTSQATEPGEGWNYDVWLTDWIAGGTGSAADLAIDEVVTYGEYYASYGDWSLVTQSAIDLSQLTALGAAIDAFVASDDPAAHLGSDIQPGYGYYDIWEMADNAGNAALKAAVENAVIQNWHTGTGTAPAGLSIFYDNSFPGEYTSIAFCDDTDWC